MKDLFPGYYKPTDEEFKALWRQCLFVPDTNILLHVYEYSQETREKLVEIFNHLSGQLWMPHQVALEFQRNRPGVIHRQVSASADVKRAMEQTHGKLRGALSQYTHHPFLPTAKWQDELNVLFSKMLDEAQSGKEEYPDLLTADHLREQIDQLFDGKVGAPFSQDRVREIKAEGKERFKSFTPPGHADRGKGGEEQQYGDLLLWHQVMEYAKQVGKPVVFITDDAKEDWWHIVGDRTIGPRPELIDEFRHQTNGLSFYMYSAERFLRFAQDHLAEKVRIQDSTIGEARNVASHASVRLASAIQRFNELRDEQSRRFEENPALYLKALLEHAMDPRRHEFLGSLGEPPKPSGESMCWLNTLLNELVDEVDSTTEGSLSADNAGSGMSSSEDEPTQEDDTSIE